MKDINQFINEKFKININNIKNNNEQWSIKTAKNGDIVSWNDGNIIFIYKCLNTGYDYSNSSENDIVFHVVYLKPSKKIIMGPDTGIGTGDKPELFKLATDEECNILYDALNKNGYKWDDKKLKIVEI